jgi:hypothetical protein
MSFMQIHCDTAYEGGWLPIVDCACRAYRDSEMLVFFVRRISFGEAISGCTDCSRPRTSLAEPFFSLSLGSGAECFRHMQSCVKLAQQQINEGSARYSLVLHPIFDQTHETLCRHTRSSTNAMVPRCAARFSSSAQNARPTSP